MNAEYVTVTDTTSYSKRYDMIALCNGERVLPPVIYTPKERLGLSVVGITVENVRICSR